MSNLPADPADWDFNDIPSAKVTLTQPDGTELDPETLDPEAFPLFRFYDESDPESTDSGWLTQQEMADRPKSDNPPTVTWTPQGIVITTEE